MSKITLDNLADRTAQEFRGIRDRIYETHTLILEKIPTMPIHGLIKIAQDLKIITPEEAQDLIRETETHPITDA
jgi:hypothetical protein